MFYSAKQYTDYGTLSAFIAENALTSLTIVDSVSIINELVHKTEQFAARSYISEVQTRKSIEASRGKRDCETIRESKRSIVNKKALLFVSAAISAALVLSGCSGDVSESPELAELAELTVSTTSATFGLKEDVAIYATGIQMGYYEEEGITLDLVTSDGSAAAIQAVASGSAQISTPDAGSILGSVQSGLPVVAIGGLVQNWPWRIAVPAGSPITDGADLKGKNIGVISLASGSAPYARAFAEGNGLNAETDVNLLPVGLGAQAATALDSGDVDALALFTTAYVAIEQSGMEFDYLDNPETMDGLRSLTFIASQEAIGADKDLYERFLRASYKALVFSASNPEAAVKMGYEQFPQFTPADDIQLDIETLEDWLSTATPKDTPDVGSIDNWGAIPENDWKATQEFAINAGQIDSEQDLSTVWDPSLLDAANDFDGAAVVQEAKDYVAE